MALRIVEERIVTPPGGAYDLALTPFGRRAHALRGGPDALVAAFSQRGREVRVELLAAGAADRPDLDRAMAQAIGLAGLDDDPSGFGAIAARHPLVASLHRRFAGARLRRTATLFEAIAAAVVGQLVTYEEASASLGRLRARHGAPVEGTDLVAFPSAEVVAAIPPHELRAMGIGIRRATTLRLVASRAKSIERLSSRAPEDAIARLRSLRGVGIWTAIKVAVDGMGWADGAIEGDAVLPYVATKALTGEVGGDDALLEALEPFRPHRARVVQLLDLALVRDHGLPNVAPRPRPRIDPHRRWPFR